jgi:hypothetical protein
MSVDERNTQACNPRVRPAILRTFVRSALVGILGSIAIAACSAGGGDGSSSNGGSSGTSTVGNGGTNSNGLGGSSGTNTTGNGGSSNGNGGSGVGNGGSGVGTGGSVGNGGSTGSGGSTGTGGSVTGAGGTTGSGGTATGAGGTLGTGGTTPPRDGGAGGTVTTGAGGDASAPRPDAASGSCANTNMGVINEDASGYVCNNTWGIKGAWYCYSDGSDSTNSCKGSDGKGTGAIPWNVSSSAMCLSGTMGTGTGAFAGIGFKVNSGLPGSTAAPGTFNASNLVGFAITLMSGSSGRGTGGMILNVEYPTTTDLAQPTLDAPGVTVPGVAGTTITYNALFSDSVLANNKLLNNLVDPANLTDVKIAFFPDSVSHTYDFCIKSIVPLMSAPPPVAAGAYGPAWTNQTAQAVNGINGYAVQSAPFPTPNGNPMTMQVNATAGGVGFTYMAGGGFQAPNNGPGSFPAIISGWGPGHDGDQFYGPYKGGKRISQLTSVRSNWTFSMGSTGDAVYDVWFSNSAVQPPPNVGIELMVWIGNTGKNPLGSVASPGTPVAGRTPYVGVNGTGESVVSYWVAAPGTTSVSNFDLLPYFQDAASHGYAGLTTNSVLLGVQTGFEVYSGNWSTTDYNINIQ